MTSSQQVDEVPDKREVGTYPGRCTGCVWYNRYAPFYKTINGHFRVNPCHLIYVLVFRARKRDERIRADLQEAQGLAILFDHSEVQTLACAQIRSGLGERAAVCERHHRHG